MLVLLLLCACRGGKSTFTQDCTAVATAKRLGNRSCELLQALCVLLQVIVNGSHSIHAVNKGVSVSSRDGSERLVISTLDVPLVNAGRPNPFYNPSEGPDMWEGMSYNIVNNIWGTNYIMWVPYTPNDEPGMAFRFVIEVEKTAVVAGKDNVVMTS